MRGFLFSAVVFTDKKWPGNPGHNLIGAFLLAVLASASKLSPIKNQA
jgi:hypothetical protein